MGTVSARLGGAPVFLLVEFLSLSHSESLKYGCKLFNIFMNYIPKMVVLGKYNEVSNFNDLYSLQKIVFFLKFAKQQS